MTDVELLPCAECGMPCRAGEYHPFAACLMFKACHNSETVRANLAPLQAENERLRAEVEKVTCELMDAITRADKLTEALRLALKWAETLPEGEPLHDESVRDLNAARAALDQESE